MKLGLQNKTNAVNRKKKFFIPTDIGTRCNTFLQSNFSDIINEAFTAEMERQYAIKVLNVINDIKQGERARVLRRAITMNSI